MERGGGGSGPKAADYRQQPKPQSKCRRQEVEKEKEARERCQFGGAVAAAQQQIARPVTAVQSIVVVQNKYTQANRGTHTSKHTHKRRDILAHTEMGDVLLSPEKHFICRGNGA